MSGQAVAKKSEKFFVKLGQPGVLGRRIHSAVAGSGVAPGQLRRVDRGVVRPAEGRQDSCVVIVLLHPKAASGNDLHGLANGSDASLQTRAG